MKAVREHINEKFSEESDPITDMGIGGVHLIDNSWQRIFDLDRKILNKTPYLFKDEDEDQNVIYKSYGSFIRSISIERDAYVFRLYSDNIYWDKGNKTKENPLDKLNYILDLIKNAGIYNLFDRIESYPEKEYLKRTEGVTIWQVTCIYKDHTKQYFQKFIGEKNNPYK